MAYDSLRQKIVAFGGTNWNISLNDSWEWDAISWRQRDDSSISARVDHAMTFDAVHGQLVVFGGELINSRGADKWLLNSTARLGDVDCDGIVDHADLDAVLSAWGTCIVNAPCPADTAPPGDNGIVDVDDLLAVINNWG